MKTDFIMNLEQLVAVTREKYGSYAYATGYLTTLADAMYNSLSEHQRAIVNREVQQTIKKYQSATV